MKRRFSLGMLCALLLMIVLQYHTVTFAAENDSVTNATELVLNQPCLSSINKEGEHDWYTFTTGETNAYYYITILNESGTEGLGANLYDARNSELIDCYAASGRERTCNIRLKPNSTYYIETYMSYRGTGNYTITLTRMDDPIGNDKSDSSTININGVESHSIDGVEDSDWFMFTADKTGKYRIFVTNESGTEALHFYVYTQRDMEIADEHIYTGKADNIDLEFEAGSTYYMKFYMSYSGTGNYSFRVTPCADGHTATDIWEITKAPGCTVAGNQIMKCSECGDVVSHEPIAATGHKFGEWTITQSPTLISLGKKQRVCDVCGEIEYSDDWSKAWILPAAFLSIIVLIIGIVKGIGRKRAKSRRRMQQIVHRKNITCQTNTSSGTSENTSGISNSSCLSNDFVFSGGGIDIDHLSGSQDTDDDIDMMIAQQVIDTINDPGYSVW